MKIMKKITAMLLLAFMLISILAGCKKDNQSENGDETSGTSENEMSVLIGEGGESLYKLVRPSGMPNNLLRVCTDFYKTIRSDSEFSIKFSDDFLRADLDKSEPTEILFGAADRDEVREVYGEINFDGYAVKSVGNKIVIAAYTEENLRKASERFFAECVKIEDGGKKITFVKNIVEKGSEELFFGGEKDISEYKIVYAEDMLIPAQLLRKYIRTAYDITLEVVKHTDPESEKEILVGKTGRSESKANAPKDQLSFVFEATENKIIINADSESVLKSAMSYINNNYILTSPKFNFPKSLSLNEFQFYGEDIKEITEGADVRIMSFNILCELWDANATMEPRIYGVIGTIKYYSPDVIGIQEVSPKWYQVIRKYLGDEYVFINANRPSGTDQNYTALAYNKNKVKFITSEYKIYSVYNSTRLRSINLGVFETLEDGKRFAVTNTHFNANHKTAAEENINRNTQATELVAKIKEYTKKYDCPIFMCGDYNSKDETEAYKIIVADGTIKEAKKTAEKKGKVCLTYHDLGVAPGSASSSIDHIFYTGKARALYYTTLVDEVVVRSSDHCPIFADFVLE